MAKKKPRQPPPTKRATQGRAGNAAEIPPAKPATPPSPAALTPEQLADLLTRAGGRRVTAANVAAHVAAGAPTHADGTLHLVHYAAWLAGHLD